MEKLLGSHWHMIIDVLCVQQINSEQLWIVQIVSVRHLFRQVSAGVAVKLHCWLLIGLLLFIYCVGLFIFLMWVAVLIKI